MYQDDVLEGLKPYSPLVLTSSVNKEEQTQCHCDCHPLEQKTPNASTHDNIHSQSTHTISKPVMNKFDPEDNELKGLIDNNKKWAAAVMAEAPDFFSNIANKQEPKILWIGCSDSRVPANHIVQLGPGEIFVHRNIANVVNHTDLNCLSVLQYAVDVLKVEHIIVCGHYNCGGVTAAYGNGQYGLIDNWLRSIKDVYRLHSEEIEALETDQQRIRKLVECNVINSAENVTHSTIVQNAWANGQSLTVHAWAYDIEDGLINKLNWRVTNNKPLQNIYQQ